MIKKPTIRLPDRTDRTSNKQDKSEEKINQYEAIVEEITNENQRLNDQLRHRL